MKTIEKIYYKFKNELTIDTIAAKLDRIVLRRLRAKNIDIIFPFYLYQEGISEKCYTTLRDGFGDYEIDFLKPEDMKEIASFLRKHGSSSEKELLIRLNNGHKCYGAKYHNKIVAFTWCNFVSCHSILYSFPLKKNEAYLYDAYTTKSFRGKGIAPYLRCQLYKILRELDRQIFYSISILPNKPALKFKSKLDARPLMLGVYIRLFKRWDWSWKIKNYCYPLAGSSIFHRESISYLDSDGYSL